MPGYQARKDLHTGTVKIDPPKFCHLKYKICQNKTLFLGSQKHKIYGFFPFRLVISTENQMTSEICGNL